MNIRASVQEANFDCLVGPTHHFGGLSLGNLASSSSKARISSPQKAALQGLKKMRYLAELGFVQCVLPPHWRPHFATLRTLGFNGTPSQMMRAAFDYNPELCLRLCSSSFMWAANAATVSPSIDSLDGKLHITPSNLATMFHRSIEADFAYKVFKHIFSDENRFVVHKPLPSHDMFSDEGAANHNRLALSHAAKGLEIFVYGKQATLSGQKSRVFPSRQSKMANDAILRLHRLEHFLNIQQNHHAIDKGAFHNDVVCVANENVLLLHEQAFFEQKNILGNISQKFINMFNSPPFIIEIAERDLSIEDTVSSYLFNSQLLTKSDKKMLLFAPDECRTNRHANAVIQKIIAQENPIDEVDFFDVSESMANGGGPACLRLRVLLTKQELNLIDQKIVFSENLFDKMQCIIEKYYVDDLTIDHFFDETFLADCYQAVTEIHQTLGFGHALIEELES